DTVVAVLRNLGVSSVVDLGCGEGQLVARLLDAGVSVVACDVSLLALERARRRVERHPYAERAAFVQTSAGTFDSRVPVADALCLIEVIEHLDEWQLPLVEAAWFTRGFPHVVVSTPIAEHNVRFEGLAHGELRHG